MPKHKLAERYCGLEARVADLETTLVARATFEQDLARDYLLLKAEIGQTSRLQERFRIEHRSGPSS